MAVAVEGAAGGMAVDVLWDEALRGGRTCVSGAAQGHHAGCDQRWPTTLALSELAGQRAYKTAMRVSRWHLLQAHGIGHPYLHKLEVDHCCEAQVVDLGAVVDKLPSEEECACDDRDLRGQHSTTAALAPARHRMAEVAKCVPAGQR